MIPTFLSSGDVVVLLDHAEQERNFILLADDGKEHQVEVRTKSEKKE
jgi:hypothetical protein